MKRVAIVLLCISLLVVLTACGNRTTQGEDELTIVAASSLTDAFTEMKESFEEQHPNSKIHFSFGSSGQLQTQVEQGAPVDVFASAGQQQMDALQQKDMIDVNSRKDFVENSIVMVTGNNNENPIGGFHELQNLKDKKIAIGDPAHVPAGQYTQEILEDLGVKGQLEGQLVLCKDVRQVLSYVETGEVEVGFVFSSDAVTSNKVKVIEEASKESYDIPLYPMAIIKSSNKGELAQKWIDFVVSPEGKRILGKWGFKSVE